ncbi:hypothetical protein D3C73_1076560 [compost metagenome]
MHLPVPCHRVWIIAGKKVVIAYLYPGYTHIVRAENRLFGISRYFAVYEDGRVKTAGGVFAKAEQERPLYVGDFAEGSAGIAGTVQPLIPQADPYLTHGTGSGLHGMPGDRLSGQRRYLCPRGSPIGAAVKLARFVVSVKILAIDLI